MVARKKSDIQPLRPDMPIYPIGVAAKLLNVHPRTLRIYEAEGLIQPTHHGKRRMFSENDIRWVSCLRSMIHDQGISIPGLKRLLSLAPCWEIAECSSDTHGNCAASVDWAVPRCIRQVGDVESEKVAKAADLSRKSLEQRKKLASHS
ncbi:MAG: MerR family transcriptional regulator [Proteobacteria bacterium]|nr:MerR family transcriptional regulator [Pseudomonadota bacterium]MBU1715601.1 MerR family transcriptional regulator [Pseudomonadota bacterium]